MTSFSGVIRLAEDPGTTILADMDVFDDRLVLSASGAEIGAWPRETVDLEPTGAGFAFYADGEQIIIEPSDLDGFAGAMGLATPTLLQEPPAADTDVHLTRLQPGALLDADPGGDVDPAWVHEQASTFGSLRERSAAEWHVDDTVARPVIYVLGVSIVLAILGAVLDWGDGSLFIDDFAVERVLFGLIAVSLVAAAYMAISEKQERRVVGLTAIGGGVFALLVLWLWGRSTGVAFGYLIGSLAAMVAIVGGILAVADWSWVVFPRKPDTKDQVSAPKKRGRLSRLFRRR
jgi:hypothetical protein